MRIDVRVLFGEFKGWGGCRFYFGEGMVCGKVGKV